MIPREILRLIYRNHGFQALDHLVVLKQARMDECLEVVREVERERTIRFGIVVVLLTIGFFGLALWGIAHFAMGIPQ